MRRDIRKRKIRRLERPSTVVSRQWLEVNNVMNLVVRGRNE